MRSTRSLAAILFGCTFAAQSAYLVLTPVLPEVAAEFDVSTATAGQVRTAGAVVALAAALWAATAGRRLPRRSLLLAALGLALLGSVTSAAAPSLEVLAAGQCLIGAAAAIAVAASVSAAAEWSDDTGRARVVAWTIVGAPSAWVVTMPAIGALAAADWRLAFVVPVAATALAAGGLRRAPGGAPPAVAMLRGWRRLAPWAVGELLFGSAWGGTLVYTGSLLRDFYGMTPASLGIALAVGAAAYLPGTFLAKSAPPGRAQALLAALALVLAACVALLATLRTTPALSTAAFAAVCFLGGARQYLGSSVGLALAADRNAAMALRAAAAQVGWIVGAAGGGAALAAGGYPGFAATIAGLFVAGGLPYALELRRPRRARGARPAPPPRSAAAARGC